MALDLESIKDRFETAALATKVVIDATKGIEELIRSFFFDDLSKATSSRDTDYHLFLMKPMDSIRSEEDRKQGYEDYTMEFFIFEQEGDKDADERVVSWNRSKKLARQFIKDLQKSQPTGDSQDIQLKGDLNFVNGVHKAHSDQLIGVQVTGILRVFTGECDTR